MGRGTIGEVLNGLVDDSWVGSGRVEGPPGRSGMGRRLLGKSETGCKDPRGGPGRVGGPSGRFGMGRGTIGEVRDGLGDDWGGLERVGDSWIRPRWVGGPSR